jgi:hypothetical protein
LSSIVNLHPKRMNPALHGVKLWDNLSKCLW